MKLVHHVRNYSFLVDPEYKHAPIAEEWPRWIFECSLCADNGVEVGADYLLRLRFVRLSTSNLWPFLLLAMLNRSHARTNTLAWIDIKP